MNDSEAKARVLRWLEVAPWQEASEYRKLVDRAIESRRIRLEQEQIDSFRPGDYIAGNVSRWVHAVEEGWVVVAQFGKRGGLLLRKRKPPVFPLKAGPRQEKRK